MKVNHVALIAFIATSCNPSDDASGVDLEIKSPSGAQHDSEVVEFGDFPKGDLGGETKTPYTSEEVKRLKILANRGELSAHEKLFDHFSFENDIENADFHLSYLFKAKSPVALAIIAGRMEAYAYRLDDKDPLKLCKLLEANDLFDELYAARNSNADAPGDSYRVSEIIRLRKLHPEVINCE